ncbi:ribosome maturation factor RimM [Compostimonas suwonensis]|uniref:Ribosome maturation factor RimM n=1 Tax=Compostimonas suwonensis TaxID=1048394 RepID=A0A2M9BZV4_9MICO|nr:ribosome maturation factor RimM [Compostimonas suwonensis]PJJ63621.1 16S rRNA processing protein RimM [Compostimonas suwonensis]
MSRKKSAQTQLRVGRLTKAHGLKGAIKLEMFTDDPERRFVPGAVFSLQVPDSSPWHGKSIELVELRWYNGHPVGFFKDVPDRTAAEALAKAILWIEQDVDEAQTEEDAWYDYQLVGLTVLRDGVGVGRVIRVDHLPAQDLLVVHTATGDVMVPFVKAIVPAVDIDGGTLTVTPPVGLFEELPDDPADEAGESAGIPESDIPEPDDPTDADAAAAETADATDTARTETD